MQPPRYAADFIILTKIAKFTNLTIFCWRLRILQNFSPFVMLITTLPPSGTADFTILTEITKFTNLTIFRQGPLRILQNNSCNFRNFRNFCNFRCFVDGLPLTHLYFCVDCHCWPCKFCNSCNFRNFLTILAKFRFFFCKFRSWVQSWTYLVYIEAYRLISLQELGIVFFVFLLVSLQHFNLNE